MSIPTNYQGLSGFRTVYSETELRQAIALVEAFIENNLGGGGGGSGITEAQVKSAIESATNIDGLETAIGLLAKLTDTQPVTLSTLPVAFASGASSASTQRVVAASDSPEVTSIGSTATSAAASDTATASLIAFMKRLLSVKLLQGTQTTSNSLAINPASDASFVVGAGTNFIGRSGVRTFRAAANFTRPADTTAYAVNDAITNSTSSPTVLSADLASFGGANNGFICITNARVISDAAQSTLPLANVIIFNQTFTATNDNSALSITDAVAQTGGIVIPCLNTYNLGANSRCVSDNGQWIMQLGAASTSIFFTLQAANAYTPVSGERFDVVIDGFVL